MAPSRAILLRRIASAATAPCLQPTSRLLTTSTSALCRTQQSSVLRSSLSRQSHLPTLCTRSYSQSASAAPEAPDYLNEAELHVFNKIKAELEPVKLEVCNASPLSRFLAWRCVCAELGALCVDHTDRTTDYCTASMHVISVLRGILQVWTHIRCRSISNTSAEYECASVSV